jgi:hypothetical protein
MAPLSFDHLLSVFAAKDGGDSDDYDERLFRPSQQQVLFHIFVVLGAF